MKRVAIPLGVVTFLIFAVVSGAQELPVASDDYTIALDQITADVLERLRASGEIPFEPRIDGTRGNILFYDPESYTPNLGVPSGQRWAYVPNDVNVYRPKKGEIEQLQEALRLANAALSEAREYIATLEVALENCKGQSGQEENVR